MRSSFCSHSSSAPRKGIISETLCALHALLTQLGTEWVRLCESKRELHSGLAEYYTRVLPVCEYIQHRHSGAIPYEPQPPRFPCPIEVQFKSLYRATLKLCHPDYGGKSCDAQRAVAAYRDRDIARLWKLAIRLAATQIASASLAAFLEREHQKAEQLFGIVTARHAQLLASPEWRLKHKLQEAKIAGFDITAAVSSRLEARLQTLRH